VNVFIISPSYLMQKKRDFTAALRQLRALGFKVINPDFPTVLPSPREKAEQLHRAFTDPTIDLILALRGGYSAMKALPFIDFELIRHHPKLLAGFSDLSALLNPIYERTGMATLHAPMVINLDNPSGFTTRSLMNAVSGYPQRNLFRGARVRVYRPGRSRGTLKGGNLITLTALLKTDWEIDTEGAVLFFEDVDELQHEVDRYLTQWLLAGKFAGISGLILGDFRGIRNRKVYDILATQMELDVPVVHCPNIGHVTDKLTLPVGAEVELDTEEKRLEIKQMNFPGGNR